jgi:hypothetical protein
MKISEIVDQLNFIQAVYGDLSVLMEDAEVCQYDVESVRQVVVEDVDYAVASFLRLDQVPPMKPMFHEVIKEIT